MTDTYIYDKTITEDGEVIESEKVTKNTPKKLVFITNGTGGCGKDTFADILNDFVDVTKISSIDPIKQFARFLGWQGGKSEKDRNFLSDLKLIMTEYDDTPFKWMQNNYVLWSIKSDFDQAIPVLLIDIREPEEIERAKKAFNAKTILIKNDRVAPITSNMADAGVFNYDYDFVIENNGTLEDFAETVKKWAEENVL